MLKLHRILLAGALVAMASTTSMAGSLGPGGLQGGGGVVNVTVGTNLHDATKLTMASGYTLTGSTGSLTGISGTTDAPIVLDTTNIGAFKLEQVPNFTFTASNLISDQITGTPTLGGRNIVLVGTITKGNNNGTAFLSISYSVSPIGEISSSFSLSVVPEPSSVALAGIGLAAAGLFGLRKRLAK